MPTPSDKYRYKKIKGVFIVILAIVLTLGYNAILLHHDRTTPPADIHTTTELETDADTYTRAEVAERNTPDNCWMAAYGNVYDLTDYVAEGRHPGGQSSLISGCGQEVTESFDRIHSTRAKDMLEQYQIGHLIEQ